MARRQHSSLLVAAMAASSTAASSSCDFIEGCGGVARGRPGFPAPLQKAVATSPAPLPPSARQLRLRRRAVPGRGRVPMAGVFDPPYYEWCQFVGAAAAAAVVSGISVRPVAPNPSNARRSRSVLQAAISVERGEKAYTVQKSEEIFNAAKEHNEDFV